MLDLEKAWLVSQKAALLGREVLLDYFGHLSKVSEKNQAGLVSEADEESERVITQYLRTEFPEIGVLGEEASFKNPGQSPDKILKQADLWLIDPLDGTTNYVHKFPIYCVSIGLQYQGELVIGTVDIPALRRTYTAASGMGAFMIDGLEVRDVHEAGETSPISTRQRLSVSSRKSINESLLATGFSSYDKQALQEQLCVFSALVGEARGVRRAGSAAYDMCLVAEGVFEAYWEKNLSPWDTAAGTVLVREAGGVVTNFESREKKGDSSCYSPFDKSVIASNGKMHDYIQEKIRSCRLKS